MTEQKPVPSTARPNGYISMPKHDISPTGVKIPDISRFPAFPDKWSPCMKL